MAARMTRMLIAAAIVCVAAGADCPAREVFNPASRLCECKPGLTRPSVDASCGVAPQIVTTATEASTALHLHADKVMLMSWDDATDTASAVDIGAALESASSGSALAPNVTRLSSSVNVLQAAVEKLQTGIAEKASAAGADAMNGTVNALSASLSSLQTTVGTLMEKVDANSKPLTEENSGQCLPGRIGAIRYNLVKKRPEVCTTALIEDAYFWQPLDAVPGCADVDVASGVCTECFGEAQLSGPNCILPADVVHITFEKTLADLSGNGRDGLLVGGTSYGLLDAPDAPEGNHAMDLNGQDTYVQLPAFSMGGAMTACAYVKYTSFQYFSRVFDFANGAGEDHILVANSGNTPDLLWEIWRGDQKKRLSVKDFWSTADGAWVHSCFTVNDDGKMQAFLNGELQQEAMGWAPTEQVRTSNLIGASNFPQDKSTHAAFDDFRIYSRVLTPAAIKALYCSAKDGLACSGLLGHWRFEANALDSSPARWHASVIGAHPLNVYTRSYVDGEYALRFDGLDDYAVLPSRMLGGALSICAAMRFDSFPGWSRVVDFANGPAMDNILLAQVDKTRDLFFEIFQGNVGKSLRVPDAWWRADGATAHVCATVTIEGVMTAYINGRQVGQNLNGWAPNYVKRTNMYIGKSQWTGDAPVEGSIDDMRIWNRALSADDVKAVRCQGRLSTLDCVGLLAHYSFEGNALDSSGSGWHGDVVRGTQSDSVFTNATATHGSRALRVLGADAYIRLRPRALGGAMSICADMQMTAIQRYARLVDFGNGPSSDNIIIANVVTSTDLVFTILDGSTSIGKLTVPKFWDGARDALTPVCFTVDTDGKMVAYMNGQSKGTTAGKAPPLITRDKNFIAESNWDDASLHGLIDNLRIYEYALTAAEVAALASS